MSNLDLIDCIFNDCDLSNIDFNTRYIRRIKFTNCKLVGTIFDYANFTDITFDNCNLKYISFNKALLKNIEFINCNLEEATFMETAIKDIIFNDCNLKSSDFYKTSLCNIDLSTSNIEGIRTDINNLRGAKINFEQAIAVLNMLGIHVK